MKKIFKLLPIFLIVLSANVLARASVPIVDHSNVQISSANGKLLTLDQVKKAITLAGDEQAVWKFTQGESPNSIVGTLVVKNKHTAIVDIKYSATEISVLYKNSEKLNYWELDGVRYIHPNYNKWIQTFINNIKAQAFKMNGAGK